MAGAAHQARVGAAMKHALITGGSHGIGLATALAFGGLGYRVTITGRSQERLVQAGARIAAAGGMCLPIAADALTDTHSAVIMEGLRQSPGVDILVNNVGGGGHWGEPLPGVTPWSTWQEVYWKNARAAAELTMALAPQMAVRGWGRVVTVSSIHGKEAGGRPWIAMAKAAEIALMKSFAQVPYFVRNKVTFNTVAPGALMIPGTWSEEEAQLDPEGFDKRQAALPLGRLGTAEEVAAVIAFLCSPQASYVNGACFVVDGGESKIF